MKQRGCGDPKFLSCNADGSKKTVDSKGVSSFLYKPSSKKLNYDVTPKKNVCGSASQGGQACQLECAKVQAKFCGCGANSAGCLADRGADIDGPAFQQSGTWWPKKCAKTGESCKAGPECADHDLVTGKGTQCCKGTCKQKKADWIGAYYCPDESKCWSQCCDDSTCKSLFPPAKSGDPFPKPVCVANKCKALADVGDVTGVQVGCSGGRGYKNQDGYSKQCKSGISCGGKCKACRNWGDCDRTPGNLEFCGADFTCKKLLANGEKTGLQTGCSGGKSGQGQLTLSDGYQVKCQSGISCGGFCKQCVGAKDCADVKDAPLCIDRMCKPLLGLGGVTGAQVGVSGGRGYPQDGYSKKCASGISAGGKCKACRNWGDCDRTPGNLEFCGADFTCKKLLANGEKTGLQTGCSGGKSGQGQLTLSDGYQVKCQSGISCGGFCKQCVGAKDCADVKDAPLCIDRMCKPLLGLGGVTGAQVGVSGGRGYPQDGYSKKCASGISAGGKCKACRNWGDCPHGEFCQSFKCTSLLGIGGITGAQTGCSGGRGYTQDGYSKKCKSGISCGGKCKACRNWGDCNVSSEYCNLDNHTCSSKHGNNVNNHTVQFGCATSGEAAIKCKSGCSCGGWCHDKTRTCSKGWSCRVGFLGCLEYGSRKRIWPFTGYDKYCKKTCSSITGCDCRCKGYTNVCK